MSSVKWKITSLDLRDVGTGDSVEVTRFAISLSDSDGSGLVASDRYVTWVPRESIYYADSATARGVAQSAAFDNWLEIDSEHTNWMQRVQWELKTELWNRIHDYYDSDNNRLVKTVELTDSADVANPLGL
jgi:hypothetical protein